MKNAYKGAVAAVVGFAVLVVGQAVAGAQQAASITTGLVNTGQSELESVLPIVAAGFIGIAAAMFAIRWVYRAVKGGGRA